MNPGPIDSGTAPLMARDGAEGSSPPPEHGRSQRYVVLAGNPNCGKTTLFNALTGLREKVGNYGGVTVERKEGRFLRSVPDDPVAVIDLPGTYSLVPHSPDEEIARDVLFGRVRELPPPCVVVLVVDAANLQRNLYFATQVIELGYPTVVALNMLDVAEEHGHVVDAKALTAELGATVVPVIASEGSGVEELTREVVSQLKHPRPSAPRLFSELPPGLASEIERVASALPAVSGRPAAASSAEAVLLLTGDGGVPPGRYPASAAQVIAEARSRLAGKSDHATSAIEARHRTATRIRNRVTHESGPAGETPSDKIDRVVTHKIWGTLIFIALMALVFQSIFTFAQVPMAALESGIDYLGSAVAKAIPEGDLQSLLVDGIIAGVGAVVVFLPQILMLFLFIGFLEDSGYMARAALVMDRFMSRVGLHGKSFIPMLSSFACAIPGILATRTIESPKGRLVTILIAPLMSCSARLPVYTLLIAASIPDIKILGFLKLTALTMLAMYLLGVVVALGMAWIFKRTLLREDAPLLIMELPPYKKPSLAMVLRQMWDRSFVFLKQAGTIILGINIVLWFLAAYPKDSRAEAGFQAQRAAILGGSEFPANPEQAAQLEAIEAVKAGTALRHSFAGRLGHAIEPIIAPLGFDWRIGIGIITSFAAREVFVSAMSTVYNVGSKEYDGEMSGLTRTLKEQKRPDGSPMYTVRTSLALMVFYVFALQCVSTIAVVKRETNSWKWPAFQWIYLGLLAWIFAFLTYQVGGMLGLS